MTAILVLGATILFLVLALEPARRRRQQWAPRPGVDSSRDRDVQRLQQELSSRTDEARTSPAVPALRRTVIARAASSRAVRPHLGRHSAV